MSSVFEFNAVNRTSAGTGTAKAVRRKGYIPAIVYGGSSEPEMIELAENAVNKSLLNEAVYSHILQLNIGGTVQSAILKGLQRHPAKDNVIHMDFMRVSMDEKIKVHVPLHFVNEEISLGVKAGGVVTHSIVEVEISCLPDLLPEYIEVDLAPIDIGGSIHLMDLVVPEGIELLALTHGEDHNSPVAQILKTKVAASEDEEAVADAEPDAES